MVVGVSPSILGLTSILTRKVLPDPSLPNINPGGFPWDKIARLNRPYTLAWTPGRGFSTHPPQGLGGCCFGWGGTPGILEENGGVNALRKLIWQWQFGGFQDAFFQEKVIQLYNGLAIGLGVVVWGPLAD